jgi:hypothetical protein
MKLSTKTLKSPWVKTLGFIKIEEDYQNTQWDGAKRKQKMRKLNVNKVPIIHYENTIKIFKNITKIYSKYVIIS